MDPDAKSLFFAEWLPIFLALCVITYVYVVAMVRPLLGKIRAENVGDVRLKARNASAMFIGNLSMLFMIFLVRAFTFGWMHDIAEVILRFSAVFYPLLIIVFLNGYRRIRKFGYDQVSG